MSPVRHTSREDIVITGIACRFAGAGDVTAFWRQILQKKAIFSEVSFSEKLSDGLQTKPLFNATVPTRAALLGDLFSCNPADQYFPRKINAGENPDLFFAVQLVIDAIRNSGSAINKLPTDRVALCLGYAPPFNASSVNWLQHTLFLQSALGIIKKFFPGATLDQLEEIRSKLATALPDANPYSFLSAIPSVTTSWISHLLGFAGPSFVLDEGAISGIQAIQCAMDHLRAKRADIALAGAIQPPLNNAFIQGISGTYRFSQGTAVHPFSRESDGTLPGEGGGFFVLKRLKDALRQGDRIYAIIRGTGITAASLDPLKQVPTKEQLVRAMSRALHASDSAPESIQLIEANGSGVPHSDEVELSAFKELYGEKRTKQPLVAIGSVKGNFGHTLWASSIAGITKAALAIYHKQMPPQVSIEKPYPELSSPKSPICLLTETRPWLSGGKQNPRRCLVSCVDFTGTCGAIILEEYTGGAL